MVNKTVLTVLVSIILTVIMISLVNVGTSIVLTEPRYDNYCENNYYKYDYENISESGRKTQDLKRNECNDEYQAAQKPFNQYRYYIFAGIGFALLLAGLYFKENIIILTGLAAGGILVAEGIVINLQNKGIVFVSLIAILAVFGVVAYRVINKYDDKKVPVKKKTTSKKKK